MLKPSRRQQCWFMSWLRPGRLGKRPVHQLAGSLPSSAERASSLAALALRLGSRRSVTSRRRGLPRSRLSSSRWIPRNGCQPSASICATTASRAACHRARRARRPPRLSEPWQAGLAGEELLHHALLDRLLLGDQPFEGGDQSSASSRALRRFARCSSGWKRNASDFRSRCAGRLRDSRPDRRAVICPERWSAQYVTRKQVVGQHVVGSPVERRTRQRRRGVQRGDGLVRRSSCDSKSTVARIVAIRCAARSDRPRQAHPTWNIAGS